MLRRVFNLAEWIPSAASQTLASHNPFQLKTNPFQTAQPSAFQPTQNPFEQTAAANQPVTFNQFPPAQTNPPNDPYAANTSNGYSQNNQTETYYQAETNHFNYNFQNNHSNFAPSKYSNQTNTYQYAPNSTNSPDRRRGARQAAIFIIVNAFFFRYFKYHRDDFRDFGRC